MVNGADFFVITANKLEVPPNVYTSWTRTGLVWLAGRYIISVQLNANMAGFSMNNVQNVSLPPPEKMLNSAIPR